MLDALYIAATGLHAQQTNIDGISNNLANVNTPAFKKNRVVFDDLMYRQPVGSSSALNLVSQQLQMGMGSAVVDNSKVFTVGDLRPTDNALDVAIRGRGFIELELENGDVAYTRLGSLRIDSEGYLETKGGFRLASRIQIPPDTIDVLVAEDGVVSVRAGSEGELFEQGQIELVNFMDPSSLKSTGEGLYIQTEAAGPAIYGSPGEDGLGTLTQGFLEASNVDLVEELTELMVAQRAYGVVSQVLRASDEIMQITNNLRS